LDNLSEGNHTLIVYSHAADGKEMSRSREFMVDYDYIPLQNPFGLPDNLPNGTAILPPAGVKTGTPQPTINAEPPIDGGSFQPLENPLTYIVIVCISVPSLVGLLVFRKKLKRPVSLEDEGLDER
jgi:hypothetical protein